MRNWVSMMSVKIVKINGKNEYDKLTEPAKMLADGKLVAFPTETVYGLGGNALCGETVKKIYEAKGRPSDNPLIVHIAKKEDVYRIAKDVPPAAEKILETLCPGPITFVVEKSDLVPDEVTAGGKTVAIRMPEHETARELILRAGVPVAAPSANLSGKPSPTTAKDVFEDMEGRIPMLIDGGDCEVGVESTVVDMTRKPAMILRPGGVTREMMEEVIGQVEVHQAILAPLASDAQAASPGMKYKHYAPKARVRIITGDRAAERICELYDAAKQEGVSTVIFSVSQEETLFGDREFYAWGDDLSDVAHHLFSALRMADEKGYALVLCHSVDTDGVGLAVMNRLVRAAGFDIEEA